MQENLIELMVWSSDRRNNLQDDATKPYEWNVGNYNNIYLNAYYKGDDPDNVGKDSQSLYGMADFIRGYYKNIRVTKYVLV